MGASVKGEGPKTELVQERVYKKKATEFKEGVSQSPRFVRPPAVQLVDLAVIAVISFLSRSKSFHGVDFL